MGEEVSASQRCLEMREELQKCCPMEQSYQGDVLSIPHCRVMGGRREGQLLTSQAALQRG